jgi:GNAT superfamily N-acetyltransferase
VSPPPHVHEVRCLERDALGEAVAIDVSEEGALVYELRDGVLVAVPTRHRRPRFSMADWEPRIDEWRAIVDGGGMAWGAFASDTIVGIAVFRPRLTPDTDQLALLYVDRGHRREGVASRLVGAVEDEARARGSVWLYVSAVPSDSAVPFYLGRGFVPVATPHPALYAREPDDIHMIKDLAAHLAARSWSA